MKPARFKVFADYHQVHISEVGCVEELTDAWGEADVTDRLAVGERVIGVATARNMDVPVVLEIVSAAPMSQLAGAQHVTECSLSVPSGKLEVRGATESDEETRRFSVPPGTLRVRVTHFGLDKLSEDGLDGKDRYHVAMWPAPAAKPAVLLRYVAKPKPAKKDVKAPKTQKQAVQAALQGSPERALQKLVELSTQKGDALAAVGAAELLAFRGEWAEVIAHAGTFIAGHAVIGARNVMDEIMLLLARAGRETGDWKAVEAACERLPEKSRGLYGEGLRKVVTRKGKPEARKPRGGDAAKYREAVAETPTQKAYAKDAKAMRRRLAALASVFGMEDDLVLLVEKHPTDVGFPHAVEGAAAMARQGRDEAAWKVIEAALPTWHPTFACSAAPFELLVDPALELVMTPQRCEQVLVTRRGPSK